jgi:hypothetical protein
VAGVLTAALECIRKGQQDPGSPAVIWIQVAVAHGAHTLGSFPADRGCSPLLVKLGRDCWAVLAHGGQLSSCGIVRVV